MRAIPRRGAMNRASAYHQLFKTKQTMETMYVTFHKGPSSAYDPAQHAGGIYQCTDTQDTWVFGVKNSGAPQPPAFNVIPYEDIAATGTVPEDTMAAIEDSAQRGAPLFARSQAGVMHPVGIYTNNESNIALCMLGCFVVGTERFQVKGESALITKATRACQYFGTTRNL